MRLFIPLLVALLISGITPCQADVTEYDIEIVIFEDLSDRYLDSEKWPRIEHALPLEEKSQSLNTDGRMASATPNYPDNKDVITIAKNNSTMLKQYVKKLDSSPHYKVLVYKTWRQAGLDAESAIDIAIDSKKEQQDNDELASSVSGNVKITLGRYLHIYTDLVYKRPSSPNAPVPVSLEDSRFSEFLIKSHRRMRSKELHYLDHPMVGILVMALPVESVKKDEQQKKITQ